MTGSDACPSVGGADERTSLPARSKYIKGTAGVVKSNPSDPSDFEKDTNLHQVFYGLAYTPFLSQVRHVPSWRPRRGGRGEGGCERHGLPGRAGSGDCLGRSGGDTFELRLVARRLQP